MNANNAPMVVGNSVNTNESGINVLFVIRLSVTRENWDSHSLDSKRGSNICATFCVQTLFGTVQKACADRFRSKRASFQTQRLLPAIHGHDRIWSTGLHLYGPLTFRRHTLSAVIHCNSPMSIYSNSATVFSYQPFEVTLRTLRFGS